MNNLRVAAAQLDLVEFDAEQNLRRAARWIRKAGSEGVELVVLPEFLNVGFKTTAEIFTHAEPMDGPTVNGVAELAAEHRLMIAFTFAERDGEHIYNRAVIMGPEGLVATRRKNKPPMAESFFYCGTEDDAVVEAPFGSVGIAICADTMKHDTYMQIAGRADLMLIMTSAPMSRTLGQRFLSAEEWHALPRLYARNLGIPVIMADRTGTGAVDLPTFPWLSLRARFTEASCVVDPVNKVDETAGRGEGLAVGTVAIPDSRPEPKPLQSHDGFVLPKSLAFRLVYRRMTARGARAYARDRRRLP